MCFDLQITARVSDGRARSKRRQRRWRARAMPKYAHVCPLQSRSHDLQTKLAEFADGKLKGEKLAKAKERFAALALQLLHIAFRLSSSCYFVFRA